MVRLGMTRDPTGNFAHRIKPTHPLRQHLTYRIGRP